MADKNNLEVINPSVDLRRMIDKSRASIAMADPVGFLIRVMAGEEFDGEKLSLHGRTEVAKFLASRTTPIVTVEESEGRASGGSKHAPLTIIMNTGDVVHADPKEVAEQYKKAEADGARNIEASFVDL